MSVTITERDLKEAYAEIEAIQNRKRKVKFSDELFQFISEVGGTLHSRGKISFDSLNDFITRKGWANFPSGEVLRRDFRKEQARRESEVKNG